MSMLIHQRIMRDHKQGYFFIFNQFAKKGQDFMGGFTIQFTRGSSARINLAPVANAAVQPLRVVVHQTSHMAGGCANRLTRPVPGIPVLAYGERRTLHLLSSAEVRHFHKANKVGSSPKDWNTSPILLPAPDRSIPVRSSSPSHAPIPGWSRRVG